MKFVSISVAKSSLSRLVYAIESGAESEVVIARDGRPAARLVPLANPLAGKRLGVARGRFVVPDSIDSSNARVERLFDVG